MASVNLAWSGGYDIHLLPGETSDSLLGFLFIFDDATPPNVVPASRPPADVASIAFMPNFVSFGAPPTSGGVTVDTATGKVTVGAAAAVTLKSFVLEAVVKLTDGKTLGPIPVRVLVHKSIKDIWLTPSKLTIRHDAPGQRLTVLARFDDDTVGDITRRPGIAWSSNNSTKIAVAANGDLSATTDSATATIRADHAGRHDEAKVDADRPWSTPVAVTLLPGSAGIPKAAKVPNILFLAEGFKAAEQRKYEALARELAQRMLTEPSLRPYDLVRGKVNFWMAFVPSRDRGTSPLYDLTANTYIDGKLFGDQTTLPVKPPPPPLGPPAGTPPKGAPYTLANLIYQVGLPTPADASVPPAAARLAWAGRYGDNIADRVSDAVYLEWRDLNQHRLANEVDTAFGLGNGDRPKMHGPSHKRIADFNPLRTTRGHLDVFLRNLTVGTTRGPAIGAIWATSAPAAPTSAGLPTGLRVGQDSRFVCMILGGTPYTGVEHGNMMVASVEQRGLMRAQDYLLSPQLDFVPYDLPAKAPLELVSRVAHETSHAFGLDDEYGEFDELRIPATKEGSLASMGNTQPGSVLETDQALDPTKLTNIKWLWPRIDHAGVLAAPPVAGATTFDITLMRGHARGLRAGDFIRLRHRPLLIHPEATGRLRIDKVKGDVVTATAAPGTSITAGDWHPGDIVIRPVRGAPTPGDRDGADLTLVAPIILEHLSASALPLDLAPGSPSAACAVDRNDVQRPANLPAGLPFHKPRYSAQIVGLYDGGHRYFCGVYHPSGACVMRSHGLIPMPDPKRENTLMFCPVCRYVLVDQLDPTKHKVIDKDYAGRYPQP